MLLLLLPLVLLLGPGRRLGLRHHRGSSAVKLVRHAARIVCRILLLQGDAVQLKVVVYGTTVNLLLLLLLLALHFFSEIRELAKEHAGGVPLLKRRGGFSFGERAESGKLWLSL